MSGRRWVAGYNRPGYLPDSDPAELEDFGEAVQFLAEELGQEAERLGYADSGDPEAESDAEACEMLAAELCDNAPPNREWSGTAAGFEWWIKESPNAPQP